MVVILTPIVLMVVGIPGDLFLPYFLSETSHVESFPRFPRGSAACSRAAGAPRSTTSGLPFMEKKGFGGHDVNH